MIASVSNNPTFFELSPLAAAVIARKHQLYQQEQEQLQVEEHAIPIPTHIMAAICDADADDSIDDALLPRRNSRGGVSTPMSPLLARAPQQQQTPPAELCLTSSWTQSALLPLLDHLQQQRQAAVVALAPAASPAAPPSPDLPGAVGRHSSLDDATFTAGCDAALASMFPTAATSLLPHTSRNKRCINSATSCRASPYHRGHVIDTLRAVSSKRHQIAAMSLPSPASRDSPCLDDVLPFSVYTNVEDDFTVAGPIATACRLSSPTSSSCSPSLKSDSLWSNPSSMCSSPLLRPTELNKIRRDSPIPCLSASPSHSIISSPATLVGTADSSMMFDFEAYDQFGGLEVPFFDDIKGTTSQQSSIGGIEIPWL